METTAAGVENSEQLEELGLQGCSSVQSYLFSQPVDATSLLRMLSEGSTARNVA